MAVQCARDMISSEVQTLLGRIRDFGMSMSRECFSLPSVSRRQTPPSTGNGLEVVANWAKAQFRDESQDSLNDDQSCFSRLICLRSSTLRSLVGLSLEAGS